MHLRQSCLQARVLEFDYASHLVAMRVNSTGVPAAGPGDFPDDSGIQAEWKNGTQRGE
jgi:hypothetical protein